jgi:hypothetical protein
MYDLYLTYELLSCNKNSFAVNFGHVIMFHGAIPKTNIQIHISYKIGMHVRGTGHLFCELEKSLVGYCSGSSG